MCGGSWPGPGLDQFDRVVAGAFNAAFCEVSGLAILLHHHAFDVATEADYVAAMEEASLSADEFARLKVCVSLVAFSHPSVTHGRRHVADWCSRPNSSKPLVASQNCRQRPHMRLHRKAARRGKVREDATSMKKRRREVASRVVDARPLCMVSVRNLATNMSVTQLLLLLIV